jgi:predicted outer membrane repeat protein
VIEECIFENNLSNSTGGAIAVYNNAKPKIIHSYIIGNSATSGAGIFATDESNPQVNFTQISNNNAASRGGAIYAGNNANILMDNCVVDSNIAVGPGGGLVLQDFSSINVRSTSISVGLEFSSQSSKEQTVELILSFCEE